MAAVLKPNALTSLANLKESAGITTSADDNLLVRQINTASARIERYCSRQFFMQGLTEKLAGFGSVRMRLSVRPVLTAPSTVSIDGGSSLLGASEFGLEDAEAGFLMRFADQWGGPTNWPWTAKLRPDVTQDMEAGTERADQIVVGYVGGYLTQPQYDGLAAWPGATKTLALGVMAKDATNPAGAWVVITAGVTGGTIPTWPTSNRVAGTTIIVDGTVTWMFVGTQPTLPDDLEQACTDLANGYYVRRGADLEVASESLGDASYTYGGERGDMAEGVIEILNGYRLAL